MYDLGALGVSRDGHLCVGTGGEGGCYHGCEVLGAGFGTAL